MGVCVSPASLFLLLSARASRRQVRRIFRHTDADAFPFPLPSPLPPHSLLPSRPLVHPSSQLRHRPDQEEGHPPLAPSRSSTAQDFDLGQPGLAGRVGNDVMVWVGTSPLASLAPAVSLPRKSQAKEVRAGTARCLRAGRHCGAEG
jgi:hypothetical protein